MNNFPFFRFGYPNYYYRYYPHYYNVESTEKFNSTENTNISDISNNSKNPNNSNNANTTLETETLHEKEDRKISPKYNSFANINFSSLFSSNLEDPILEILGIKLYLDDIIIISLLFFLYTEEVQDEFLFIALILLLLS